MIYRRVLLFALIVLMGIYLCGCAFFQDQALRRRESRESEAEDLDLSQRISCKNQTGTDLQVLQISLSGEENWSEDLLKNGTLTKESAVQLDFIPQEGACYDLYSRDIQGNQFWFCHVALSPGQMLVLSGEWTGQDG